MSFFVYCVHGFLRRDASHNESFSIGLGPLICDATSRHGAVLVTLSEKALADVKCELPGKGGRLASRRQNANFEMDAMPRGQAHLDCTENVLYVLGLR